MRYVYPFRTEKVLESGHPPAWDHMWSGVAANGVNLLPSWGALWGVHLRTCWFIFHRVSRSWGRFHRQHRTAVGEPVPMPRGALSWGCWWEFTFRQGPSRRFWAEKTTLRAPRFAPLQKYADPREQSFFIASFSPHRDPRQLASTRSCGHCMLLFLKSIFIRRWNSFSSTHFFAAIENS